MKAALREKGIVSTQAECLWLHLDFIKRLLETSKELFAHTEYAFTTIPTYPCGQIGIFVGSTGDSCKVPKQKLDESKNNYYNAEIHVASFVLPQFAKKALGL